ncbi:MAG: glutamate--tRNA ligase [Candidatus Hydrogenedentes bacterium]|nr:glutamate--tRNA ligase [Candidatus Hydrogenedentota bacterium]
MSTVRCRIAPSPSGFLHIGTAKMALFNWLFARKTGGAFILRLEDTDAERTDEAFVQAMCEGFKWLGIHWDEGPPFGDEPARGEFGPYRQSERKAQHQEMGHKLLASGAAYRCFCTKEALDAEREAALAEKRPRRKCPCRDLDPAAAEARQSEPHTVRFKVPEGQTVVEDLVQGTVRTDNRELDDFVILKPNGDPIFHLAVVADDILMGITHVIRGDDHLTNTARHVLLFDALGAKRPTFAHLPMVLDEAGKKFSKRLHGANVLDWRDDGYLPEALINYVALLGWTPAEENRELFTIAELTDAFDPARWSKSAARFDRKKLDWLNGQHIRALPLPVLKERLVAVLTAAGFEVAVRDDAWLLSLAEITREKLATLNQIVEQADFFFQEIAEYEEKPVKKLWQVDGAADLMDQLIACMEGVTGWDREALKAAYHDLAEASGAGLGKLVHPTRLALTGKSIGPGLFELAELLGREACIARLRQARAYIETIPPPGA